MKVYFSRSISLSKTVSTPKYSKYVNQAQCGKENFKEDFKNSHVNTSLFQKVLLGVGSGFISITSPSRGDMIAVMGEVTGPQALRYIQSKMQQSDEGRKILEEKPRISSGSVDLEKLNTYPPGTLGKAYSNFLNKYGYTPDSRNAVKFVDDLELAYVAQRYREVHDLFHTLLDMPTNMLGEVTVKWVEAIQTKLPMCAAGALFGSIRLAPKFVRRYSTKAIVEVEPGIVEKFKSGELKQRHFAKRTQLGTVTLPDALTKGIKSVLSFERKSAFKASKELNNKLQNRRVPLEETDKDLIKKLLSKKLRTSFQENFEENVNLKMEYEAKLSKMLYDYVKTHTFKPITYSREIGLQYLVTRGVMEYAAVKKVFYEIAIRDKMFSPVTYFDFGSGMGTAVWAAHDLWGQSLKEYICIDKSKEMNNIAELILKNNKIKSIPLISKVHYRQFLLKSVACDIVVSAFSLFELKDRTARLKTLTTLWNNTNDYLVLVEVGSKEGFRLIAEARMYLLKVSKQHEVDCHVFAPCPHNLACPRLSEMKNLKPCNFTVNYNNIFKFKGLDSVGGITYSYLILKKGKPSNTNQPCRIVGKTKKRHHCVTCHLCTNYGDIKTVFISRGKYGKEVYKLFKYLKWGDLIPGNLYLQESDEKKNISVEDSDGTSISNKNENSTGEYISDEDFRSDEGIYDEGEYISDGDSDGSNGDESSKDSGENSECAKDSNN